jgi:hypothetical protein
VEQSEAYKKQLNVSELVFGQGFVPQKEEHAMFMAYASAARSAQPWRQASTIATEEGDVVVKVGMNGSLPQRRSILELMLTILSDHRMNVDSNFRHRDRIVQSIVRQPGSLLTERGPFADSEV